MCICSYSSKCPSQLCFRIIRYFVTLFVAFSIHSLSLCIYRFLTHSVYCTLTHIYTPWPDVVSKMSFLFYCFSWFYIYSSITTDSGSTSFFFLCLKLPALYVFLIPSISGMSSGFYAFHSLYISTLHKRFWVVWVFFVSSPSFWWWCGA